MENVSTLPSFVMEAMIVLIRKMRMVVELEVRYGVLVNSNYLKVTCTLCEG